MRLRSPYTVLLWAVTCALHAQQAPGIQWDHQFGGTASEAAYTMVQTPDGGYVVAGSASSDDGDVSGAHGNGDMWVVRLSGAGVIQWQKALGGTLDEEAHAMALTSDGGFVLAGLAHSTNGDVSGNQGIRDGWLVKLNEEGIIVWQRTLGGTQLDEINAVQQTTDGGYAIAGWTNSQDGDVSGNHGGDDMWVLKLDDLGETQWQRCLGGVGIDRAYGIRQTPDEGYIVAGETYSNDGDVVGFHGGQKDMWVVKLDATGTLQWQKCLGGAGLDQGRAIQLTTDTGYIVAGASMSDDGDVSGVHGSFDLWLVKLDASGGIEWQKACGGSGSDLANAVQQTADGGYVMAGITSSGDGDVNGTIGGGDMWVVRLDGSGNILWQKAMGTDGTDEAKAVLETNDGGYAVAGIKAPSGAWSNLWVVKLDPWAVGIAQESVGAFSIAWEQIPGVLRVDASGWPKGASLRVQDALGRTILLRTVVDDVLLIDLHDPSPGVYLLTIRSKELMRTARVIVE